MLLLPSSLIFLLTCLIACKFARILRRIGSITFACPSSILLSFRVSIQCTPQIVTIAPTTAPMKLRKASEWDHVPRNMPMTKAMPMPMASLRDGFHWCRAIRVMVARMQGMASTMAGAIPVRKRSEVVHPKPAWACKGACARCVCWFRDPPMISVRVHSSSLACARPWPGCWPSPLWSGGTRHEKEKGAVVVTAPW